MQCVIAKGAASVAVLPNAGRRAPFTAARPVPAPQRSRTMQPGDARPRVEANFFRFGKNGFGAEDAGIVGSQGRDDYTYDDVEQYFNYMGFLATEGTYDRMEALLNSGLHPIDVILLLACSEGDTPKVRSQCVFDCGGGGRGWCPQDWCRKLDPQPHCSTHWAA
jgi:hypothetical protein